MAEHSTLTDPNLHEPKGISTASSNQVYIADGVGSGSWQYWPLGWGNYKDGGAAQNFTTTPATLSIDGAGASTEESYLPPEIRGAGSLWDTTTNHITPVAEGDSYELRLDLPITGTSGSPSELTLELDIQSGSTYGGATVIVNKYISASKTAPYTISVGLPVFVGSTFFANGGKFWLTTDTGTVTITNPGIILVRTSGGGI